MAYQSFSTDVVSYRGLVETGEEFIKKEFPAESSEASTLYEVAL